ncbi:hypothetical protein GALMADRAFT_257038 [Galerina marginata CBS 339.88]|uniref:Uncharacterized protein n=1 Tax=Galerina marginata (strain CBS 339.88) TaxID=685588 RepID=A0A067SKZ8_GALM3|nr:hypothetical protein GALMADRAFT_257038 [Galerina marginata CBS 339.88]
MDHSEHQMLSALPRYLLPTRSTRTLPINRLEMSQHPDSENDRGEPMDGVRWALGNPGPFNPPPSRSPVSLHDHSPNSQSSKGDNDSRILSLERRYTEQALEVLKLGENMEAVQKAVASVEGSIAKLEGGIAKLEGMLEAIILVMDIPTAGATAPSQAGAAGPSQGPSNLHNPPDNGHLA